jgi:hypothetical protein
MKAPATFSDAPTPGTSQLEQRQAATAVDDISNVAREYR